MIIEYSSAGKEDLDIIAPLWEKLNQHHALRSRYFAEDYTRRTWEGRRKDLLENAVDGRLRIDLARDSDTEKWVGYCVSSITGDLLGELDSIFIEKDYRRRGIGGNLMNCALAWMQSNSVTRKIVQVIIGNDEVHAFYSKYGFKPRATILMRISDQDQD